MPVRKEHPVSGDESPAAPVGDERGPGPQRLVLRSGAAPSAVTFTRRGGTARAGGAGGADDQARGRRGPAEKRWQPPEGLTPEDVHAVIGAAGSERDRLLLRALWATG